MNTSISMPKARAQEQIAAGALKSKKLPVGTTVRLEQLKTQSFGEGENEQPNDQLICILVEDKKRIKVPVREYLKMNIEDGGGEHFQFEAGQDNVKFPKSFTIKESKDRLDKDDNPIYPVFAYKLAEDFIAKGSDMAWSELVAGGEKDDHNFDIVQNYTISIQH